MCAVLSVQTVQGLRKALISVDASFTTATLMHSIQTGLKSAMSADYVRLFFVDHARKVSAVQSSLNVLVLGCASVSSHIVSLFRY